MVTRDKVRFGPYEFDSANGELRKHGTRIKLQTKPLQMLAALLERPGEVVPRDDLRQKLWPEDPFLDFEAGLNTAAKRLRDALSDSADEPRYVETIPRTGYRFIATVEGPRTRVVLAAPPEARPGNHHWPLGLALAASLCCIAWLLMRQGPPGARFQPVSFRDMQVWSARFAPDGETMLYTGQTGSERAVFAGNRFTPESRRIAGADGILISVSSRGEMALLRYSGLTPLAGGTLWRMPLNGGGAVEAERSVFSADWAPDGARFAVARAVQGSCQLEFPPGKVLFQTAGYLTNVKFDPAGGRIAFIHHPVRHDEAGSVEVVDLAGKGRTAGGEWTSVAGMAWHPNGEIWFTAAAAGSLRAVWAVPPSGGKPRMVAQAPGNLAIHDISKTGRVLVSRGSTRLLMAAGGLDMAEPEPLSWLDWSSVKDVSRDGSLVLFEENGDGVAGQSITFVHKRSDGSTMRVGAGSAMALTASEDWALTLDDKDRTVLRLLPVGPGKPRELPRSGLTYQWARYYPDGRHLLALANEGGEPLRLYRVDAETGGFEALSPPGMVRNAAVSPDGREVAALDATGRLRLFPGGRAIATDEPLAPLLWTDRGLLVQHTRDYTQVPATVSWLDPRTGKTVPFAKIGPADRYGVNAVTRIVPARDARHWVFSYRRGLSELFVSDGWK